jgi:hypothetical protein
MTHRRLGLLSAALAVSVVTVALAQPKELLALRGQPVQPVVARLGAPESQTPDASGGTTYVWTIRSMVNMPTRVTRTDYSGPVPTTYESMESRPQLTPCTLRLVVDAAGTITDSQPRGDFAACSAVVDKLQAKN